MILTDKVRTYLAGNRGIDANRVFHYIVTEWGGLCTVQELAYGLRIDAAQIPEIVVKNGTRMKLVQAAFPENVRSSSLVADYQVLSSLL